MMINVRDFFFLPLVMREMYVINDSQLVKKKKKKEEGVVCKR